MINSGEWGLLCLFLLRATRCRSAKSVTQVEPEQVTTDGHTSYPKAIAEELGNDVDHCTSQYKTRIRGFRAINGL
jgi:transposase-like protein